VDKPPFRFRDAEVPGSNPGSPTNQGPAQPAMILGSDGAVNLAKPRSDGAMPRRRKCRNGNAEKPFSA